MIYSRISCSASETYWQADRAPIQNETRIRDVEHHLSESGRGIDELFGLQRSQPRAGVIKIAVTLGKAEPQQILAVSRTEKR